MTVSINDVPPRTICQLNPIYPFIVNNNFTCGDSNAITNANTSFSTSGDSLLNGIIFSQTTNIQIPTLTHRSIGTKLVVGTPKLSSTALDNAIGVSSNAMWFTGAQNITFYSDSNPTTPTLFIGNNTVQASKTATNVNLDGSLLNFSFTSLGDVLINTNLIFNNSSTEPSTSTRVGGTRFVFSQRTNNTKYENAMGMGIASGMWLTCETNFSIFSASQLQTRFTPTTTINYPTTTNSNLVFVPTIPTTVSQFISGDLGINTNKILFLTPTSTSPISGTRTNGTSVVLNQNNTFGLQSNGIYTTTTSSFDIFTDNNTTVQKIASLGSICKILDTSGTTLVNINPAVGDILGKLTFTLNTIPTTATNIPGMSFNPSVTSFFTMYVKVDVTLSTSGFINAVYKIDGCIIGTDTVYTMQDEEYFDQLSRN